MVYDLMSSFHLCCLLFVVHFFKAAGTLPPPTNKSCRWGRGYEIYRQFQFKLCLPLMNNMTTRFNISCLEISLIH